MEKRKELNTYDLTGEYGIGYTSKGEEFYFDLEDYENIMRYTWYSNNKGYLQASKTINGKETKVKLHRMIMELTDPKTQVDHINRNKLDNRKENFRLCNNYTNCKNKNTYKNNTSGVSGVYFLNSRSRWVAVIKDNYKERRLGSFKDKNEAILTRLKEEQKLFGDLAPQRNLFKQYGIN